MSIFDTVGYSTGDSEKDALLLKRHEILEQFKKERGIENPEKLPMNEFLAFRKELFKRYDRAGV